MNLKQYAILRAVTNVIGGFSMVTLICLGIAYMSFDNAFVFQDVKIEIVNNPIKKHQGRTLQKNCLYNFFLKNCQKISIFVFGRNYQMIFLRYS